MESFIPGSKKRECGTQDTLNVFCQHSASTAILVDAHPHFIGTDKLPRVIENMPEYDSPNVAEKCTLRRVWKL